MAVYGGKRGQQSEAEIVQKGGDQVAEAYRGVGEAEMAKGAALGGAIGQPLGVLGQAIGKRGEEDRAREFEREKIGAGMAHEQGMQRERILGQAALQGQEGDQRKQQLQMELQARAQEAEQSRAFEAATSGKVTYDQATKTYQPTMGAMAERASITNLRNAQRTSILSEISQRREDMERKFSEAKMKSGQEAAELEQKATDSVVNSIEKLADLEHKARASIMAGKSDLMALISPDDAKKMGFAPGSKQGPEEMIKFADQMRTARNAQAFHLASKTGDTSYIVPGSKEQLLMTNRWIPQVRNFLENNPIMQQLALKNGPQFAGKMLNRLAAQLTMMELADPDIAAAAARAMQAQSAPQQGMGNVGQQPSTQPGSQPASRGSGISIDPRR